ncbi:hypothetical protein BGZ51_009079 [Haplosporangium sp. Z 767]|nr:hypothetical protein BGZ51_009079 [Haplosporangium sp. Z 767]
MNTYSYNNDSVSTLQSLGGRISPPEYSYDASQSNASPSQSNSSRCLGSPSRSTIDNGYTRSLGFASSNSGSFPDLGVLNTFGVRNPDEIVEQRGTSYTAQGTSYATQRTGPDRRLAMPEPSRQRNRSWNDSSEDKIEEIEAPPLRRGFYGRQLSTASSLSLDSKPLPPLPTTSDDSTSESSSPITSPRPSPVKENEDTFKIKARRFLQGSKDKARHWAMKVKRRLQGRPMPVTLVQKSPSNSFEIC